MPKLLGCWLGYIEGEHHGEVASLHLYCVIITQKGRALLFNLPRVSLLIKHYPSWLLCLHFTIKLRHFAYVHSYTYTPSHPSSNPLHHSGSIDRLGDSILLTIYSYNVPESGPMVSTPSILMPYVTHGITLEVWARIML